MFETLFDIGSKHLAADTVKRAKAAIDKCHYWSLY